MSDIAIRAEGLSKEYRIGQRVKYKALRDVLTEAASAPLRWFRRRSEAQHETEGTIWALKDVSFEIRHGETVGIIGRNGAGKSTLLKLLSRITAPTLGTADLYGRVGSLLEVGTGFHPELTGRENIFLNGAILGMRKVEINKRFDEIIDFAGVEKFIDTPVKHFSSGMYMRLAFSLAAHLEPEILMIDEVLAVGDSAFQKKCLWKMGEVAKSGRTVLFVSHNMAAVEQLCGRGIVLDSGGTVFQGDAKSAMNCYIQMSSENRVQSLLDRQDRRGNGSLRFTRIAFIDSEGNEINQILSGRLICIRFHYTATDPIKGATVSVAFNVRSPGGYLLTNLNSADSGSSSMDIFHEGFFECEWPHFNLRSGTYDCNLFCSVNGEIADWLQSAFSMSVEDGDFFNTGRLINREAGDILFQHSWSSHSSQL